MAHVHSTNLLLIGMTLFHYRLPKALKCTGKFSSFVDVYEAVQTVYAVFNDVIMF